MKQKLLFEETYYRLYDEGRKDYILTRLKNVLPKTFL